MDKQITTVVFDLGGVLVDWNPEYLYQRLIPDSAERHRFLTDICNPAWNHRHDQGIGFEDNAEMLRKEYVDRPDIQELISAWSDRFEEMFKGPIQGTLDILTQLDHDDVDLFALTNWSGEDFPKARKRFPFFARFKDIVVSGDEKIAKPDMGIYERLIERTGLKPSQSIYIDDREENLGPAAQLGFTTIHFTSPELLATQLHHFDLLSLQRCA